MQQVIDISWWQLTSFMTVLIIPLLINWHFKLGMSRDTTFAVARMTVQLILVGFYLQFLFNLDSFLLNTLWLVLMTGVGGSAIINGAQLDYRRCYIPVILGLLCGLFPLLALLLVHLIQPTPFYSAQYLIPLAGMLLGNSLSGNIVALQHLFNSLQDKSAEYESYLALGATPQQASICFVQSAMRQSLTPIIATMSTTGLVTLPGMMTGQILSGANPMLAIKYQLLIMIAIFVMLNVSIAVALVLIIRNGINSSGKVLIKLS